MITIEPTTDPKGPELHTMVALSTGRLNETARQFLTDAAEDTRSGGITGHRGWKKTVDFPVVYEKSNIGWFLPVIGKNLQSRDYWPKCLIDAFAYAESIHADWIMFDPDVVDDPDTPTV